MKASVSVIFTASRDLLCRMMIPTIIIWVLWFMDNDSFCCWVGEKYARILLN